MPVQSLRRDPLKDSHSRAAPEKFAIQADVKIMACALGEAVRTGCGPPVCCIGGAIQRGTSVPWEAGPGADELDLQRGSQELFRDSLAEFHRFGPP